MWDKLEVGDPVTRMLGGILPMNLRVTALTDDRIICGPYEFSKLTGAEIDDDLGWGKIEAGQVVTGSILRMPEYA